MRDSNATVHPGRVGIWAGSGSAAVKGDNFKVRSLDADLALDGRFADDIGPCSIAGSAYVMNSSGDTRQSVCLTNGMAGVRIGGAYVVQVDQTWRGGQ
ncbi:MAG: hypothetical protein SF069_02390 [Phycisphaerae bacterium]|nr:hypothetical protein [Phycisphaerae bacterium]